MNQHNPEHPESSRWPEHSTGKPRSASPKTQPRQIPRCKVVLLPDASNDLMFVVRTVMELTRLCRAEATHKMWEAHHCGRSVLLVTHRERAELYVEQFAGRNLHVTLEPV